MTVAVNPQEVGGAKLWRRSLTHLLKTNLIWRLVDALDKNFSIKASIHKSSIEKQQTLWRHFKKTITSS